MLLHTELHQDKSSYRCNPGYTRISTVTDVTPGYIRITTVSDVISSYISTITVYGSVADPNNFDADPDPTSEKNRIRILLYVKFCNKKFLLKNGL
jgi:hypothetical protein